MAGSDLLEHQLDVRDFYTIITHLILQTALLFPFWVLWSGLYIFHACLFRVWIKHSLKDDTRFVSSNTREPRISWSPENLEQGQIHLTFGAPTHSFSPGDPD